MGALKERLQRFIAANRRDNEERSSGWEQRLRQIYLAMAEHERKQRRVLTNTASWKKFGD